MLDLRVKNHMVFELTHLQVLYTRLLHFRDIVPVHVHEDILDHYDVELFLLPDLVDPLEQVVLTVPNDVVYHGLQQLYRGIFYSGIEELSVLVQDQVVGSSVQFLVAEGTCLLGVDLVDGFPDCVPVLKSLVLRHD